MITVFHLAIGTSNGGGTCFFATVSREKPCKKPYTPFSHVGAELLQVDGAVAVLVRLGDQLRHVVPLVYPANTNPHIHQTRRHEEKCPTRSSSADKHTTHNTPMESQKQKKRSG